MKTISKYDIYGNQIGYKSYDSNNNLYAKATFEYEYDINNNWIKKFLIIDKEKFLVRKRMIIYY